jgi:O-antigen ligase
LIYDLIKNRAKLAIDKKTIAIATSLGSILAVTVVQQIIDSSLNLNAWDGPSRLFIAGICLLYLQQKNLDHKKYLEIAIPAALILLCLHLSINKTYYWGHRWANSFVDPNSLGSQSTILSMLCILSINTSSKTYLNLLKMIGAACGLYISIKSESRGGWIAIPFMAICWFITQTIQANKNELYKNISALLILTLGITVTAIYVDSVNARLAHTLFEISAWFKDPTVYTSAGARMSMWAASLQLISENPLGYGELVIKDILVNHPLFTSIHAHGVKDMIAAGPHSDLLSKGLSLGIMGIAAYLLVILCPAVLFASKIKDNNPNIRDAANIGLIYVTGVLVVGLFNETLSLKYLCSFYGLMIACLASQVLQNNHSANQSN